MTQELFPVEVYGEQTRSYGNADFFPSAAGVDIGETCFESFPIGVQELDPRKLIDIEVDAVAGRIADERPLATDRQRFPVDVRSTILQKHEN